MYPAPFHYHRAGTVEEAVQLMSSLGEGVRALAGGQSLLPILKLRFDEPTDLVDIGRISGLDGIEEDGKIARVGALATHRRIGTSALAQTVPIIHDCANGIADQQVRTRGTIGGSVASGDPSCDWPALLHTLDAEIECQGPDGSRTVAVEEFAVDLYQTALEAGEIVTGIRFALPGAGSGGAYCAFKRSAPAYPTISVGVQLTMSGDEVQTARVALGSAGPKPLRIREAEGELAGGPLSEQRVARAADAAAQVSEPYPDQRGSEAFKRSLVAALLRRAAGIAGRRAAGETVRTSHEYY